jgi:hypothetical protein
MKGILSLCIIFLSSTIAAYAAPVVWNINNGVFSDGGTFAGSFTYDADTDTYSEIAVMVSDWTGGPTSGHIFTSDSPLNSDAGELFLSSYDVDGWDRYLGLFFEDALTNQGGTVAIDIFFSSEEIVDLSYQQIVIYQRDVLSGSVTAVPLPAAAWLFISALAGLWRLNRRQAF